MNAATETTTIFATGECVRELDGRETRRWHSGRQQFAGVVSSPSSQQGAVCAQTGFRGGARPAIADKTAPTTRPTAQLSPAAPYVRNSQTSKAAAASQVATGKLSADEARVMALLRARGVHGATGDECEVALSMLHQTAGARIRELVLAGHVFKSTLTRNTRTGRAAAVWLATDLT